MPKLIKSDLIKTFLKFDNGFNEVRLELYMLDILRIMDLCKACDNMYYYNELKWFVNEVCGVSRDCKNIDYSRKLPRIKLKEKKKWELEEISQQV
jgi:hypothetical protein